MRAATVRHPLYRWALVGMLWLVCFFNYADRQAIFSVFPVLRTELHLSPVQLGVVGSSFMWMYALFGPVAGWLCDRMSRKKLVLGGLIFWSMVTAATSLAHSYTQLIVCRALGGLGEALYFPASMSLIADYHGSATRSRAMAWHQSSVYVGSIAGGALSGWLAQEHGWRAGFALLGGAGVLLGALLWAAMHEPERERAERPLLLESGEDALPLPSGTVRELQRGFFASAAEVLRQPVARVLIAVFVGANFVAVVFLTWLPTFLHDRFHLSLAMAGLNGTAFLQIASVAGVLAGGILADKLVQRHVRLRNRGRMLTQALGLLGGVPFLFFAGRTMHVRLLLAMLTGFGLLKGVYDANLWASLYDVIPVARRGAAVGLMNSLGWLGGGTAPVVIAAFASRYSMGVAISATGAIYAVCGLTLLAAAMRPATHLPS